PGAGGRHHAVELPRACGVLHGQRRRGSARSPVPYVRVDSLLGYVPELGRFNPKEPTECVDAFSRPPPSSPPSRSPSPPPLTSRSSDASRPTRSTTPRRCSTVRYGRLRRSAGSPWWAATSAPSPT